MDNKYRGMTVNERLYEAGLIDDFYKAIEEKNAKKVIYILESVELTEPNITNILKSSKLI
jgi:hypothetical protein